MSKEWNEAGKEHYETKEMQEGRSEYASLPKEIAEPAVEYLLSTELFGEALPENREDTTESQKNKKQYKRRKRLIHKMAYMVASAVAVVIISQTLETTSDNYYIDKPVNEAVSGQEDSTDKPVKESVSKQEESSGKFKVFEEMLYVGYDNFVRSTHDFIPYEQGGLWGIVDCQGNVILEPAYQGCWAVAAREDNIDKYIMFYDDENYYIVNKEGTLINTYSKKVDDIEIGSNDIISYVVPEDGVKVIYESVDGSNVIATFTDVVDWIPFNENRAYVLTYSSEERYKLIEVLSDGSHKVIAQSDEYPFYANLLYYSGGYLLCDGKSENTFGLLDPNTMAIIGEMKLGVSIRNYPEIDWESWYRERNSNYQGPLDNFENYRYTVDVLISTYNNVNDVESPHYQMYTVKRVSLPNGESKHYLCKYTDKYLTGVWEDWQEEFIVEYDEILMDDFSYLAARDGSEWKYIDFSGNVVSDTYAQATSFNEEGYALVVDEQNVGYIIDSNFKKLKEIPNVKAVYDMRDMFCIECEFDYDSGWQDGMYLYYFQP